MPLNITDLLKYRIHFHLPWKTITSEVAVESSSKGGRAKPHHWGALTPLPSLSV